MKTPTIIALLTFILAACGPVSTEQQVIPTSTSTPTFTAIPPTTLPTETPMLTPMPFPLSPLEGLRIAYIVDGNLYLQDSREQPVQLTDRGEDHTPIFSDDGEKIAFFRGNLLREMYSINADGSQEQPLVTSSLLTTLGLGYSKFTEPRTLAFVPGTHQLLFSTHELDPLYIKSRNIMDWYGSKPNQDLLIIDTDSTEIKELRAPGQGGPFLVSPDGKMVAIQAREHIDVIGLNGKVIRQNLATYPPAWLYLWESELHWSQVSNELDVVLPIPTADALDYTGPEPRTVLQNSLDGNPGVEVHLSPPPMSDYFCISPDGNWVVYNFTDSARKTNEVEVRGIYIGNLRSGDSKLIDSEKINDLPFSFVWNPGSTHFIFWDGQDHLFLSDINGEITQPATGLFLGWIDDNRYVFLNGGVAMGTIGKEANVRVAELPARIKYFNQTYFTFVFSDPKTDQ